MLEDMIADLVWTLALIPIGIVLLIGIGKMWMSRM